MKTTLIILLGWTIWCTAPALAGEAEWPALEKALKGPRVRVTSISAEMIRDAADIYPISLPNAKCPKIAVEAYRVYGIAVRFEPTRTLKMSITGGRLASGFDAYHPIVAAAPAPDSEDGCLFPKSGLSLLQIGRYLFAFPTASSDAYAYTRSLPIVVKALRDFFKASFPTQFIHASCGTMIPRLVDVAEYLNGGQKREAAGISDAAQQGIAPDGRSPAAPARR